MTTWLPRQKTACNTLGPGQNGIHFADDSFRYIFVTDFYCILIWISTKFDPKGWLNDKTILVIAWCRQATSHYMNRYWLSVIVSPLGDKELTLEVPRDVVSFGRFFSDQCICIENLQRKFKKNHASVCSQHCCCWWHPYYGDVIMGAMASQITSLTIVYSTVYSGADQGKHQSSASLVFVREIHQWPVNSPHKLPVTRRMFPFDDVIVAYANWWALYACCIQDWHLKRW